MNRKKIPLIATLVLTACGISYAVTGDRLKSPVLVGQATNVAESISFDQGLSPSTSVTASPGGALAILAPSANFQVGPTSTNRETLSLISPGADLVELAATRPGANADTGIYVSILKSGGSFTPLQIQAANGTGASTSGYVLIGTGSHTTPHVLDVDQNVSDYVANLLNPSTSGGGLNIQTPNAAAGAAILNLTGSSVTTTFLNDGDADIGRDLDVTRNALISGTTDAIGGWANDTNQDAGAALRGLVSSGTQTFGGAKTFNGTLTAGGALVANSTTTLNATGGNTPHACVVRSTSGTGLTSLSQSCNAGEIVTGGGCDNNSAEMLFSHPTGGSTSTPPTGWLCTSAAVTNMATYAICCQY